MACEQRSVRYGFVKHILSDLKIRASYGVNGNQPGSLYGYMGLYSLGQSYMGGLGSYESSISNPNLGWEKNYNLNVGLDVSFINRIFLSVEYYNRDTKDLLYSLPISATTGFTNYLSNVGQLNNRGVELELRTINFANDNFNWTTVFNLKVTTRTRLCHSTDSWSSQSRAHGSSTK